MSQSNLLLDDTLPELWSAKKDRLSDHQFSHDIDYILILERHLGAFGFVREPGHSDYRIDL